MEDMCEIGKGTAHQREKHAGLPVGDTKKLRELRIVCMKFEVEDNERSRLQYTKSDQHCIHDL